MSKSSNIKQVLYCLWSNRLTPRCKFCASIRLQFPWLSCASTDFRRLCDKHWVSSWRDAFLPSKDLSLINVGCSFMTTSNATNGRRIEERPRTASTPACHPSVSLCMLSVKKMFSYGFELLLRGYRDECRGFPLVHTHLYCLPYD